MKTGRPHDDPMLGQRQRRWTNIGSLLGQLTTSIYTTPRLECIHVTTVTIVYRGGGGVLRFQTEWKYSYPVLCSPLSFIPSSRCSNVDDKTIASSRVYNVRLRCWQVVVLFDRWNTSLSDISPKFMSLFLQHGTGSSSNLSKDHALHSWL